MLRARPSPALPVHSDDPAALRDPKASKRRPRRAGHCVVLALLVGLLVRFVLRKQLSHRRRLKRRLKPHRFFREANPYGPYNDPLVAPAWVSHEPWWRRALGRWSRAGDQRAPVFLYSCVGTAEELSTLPHFIAHYLALGIDPERFILVLHVDDDEERARDARAERAAYAAAVTVLSSWGIPGHMRWRGAFSAQNQRRARDAAFRAFKHRHGRGAAAPLRPSDWVRGGSRQAAFRGASQRARAPSDYPRRRRRVRVHAPKRGRGRCAPPPPHSAARVDARSARRARVRGR